MIDRVQIQLEKPFLLGLDGCVETIYSIAIQVSL